MVRFAADGRPSACRQLLAPFPSALPLAWPPSAYARSLAQRRDWPQPRNTRAICPPRQATALGAHAREPTQCPHACDRRRATHRGLPACPPSYADYILTHRTREPRDHAAPSDRRITTRRRLRRRLAGGVRRTGCQRHSVRGAISARVPPSSPSRATRDQHTTQQHRHTLHSARTTPMRAHPRARARRGTRARARRPTPRSTLSPTSSSPGTPTHRRCAPQPCRQPRMQRARRAAFGRPFR